MFDYKVHLLNIGLLLPVATAVTITGSTTSPNYARPEAQMYSKCPLTHPYVLDGSKICCSSMDKIDNATVNAECDGDFIDTYTHLDCCPQFNRQSCGKPFCTPVCLPGYSLQFTNKCYKLFNTPSSIEEALDTCKYEGGRIAIPENSDQVDYFKSLVSAGQHLWLGATDEATDGVWLKYGTTETLTYIDWDSGQPDGGSQTCMMLKIYATSARFRDASCPQWNFRVICEHSPYEHEPTSYYYN